MAARVMRERAVVAIEAGVAALESIGPVGSHGASVVNGWPGIGTAQGAANAFVAPR